MEIGAADLVQLILGPFNRLFQVATVAQLFFPNGTDQVWADVPVFGTTEDGLGQSLYRNCFDCAVFPALHADNPRSEAMSWVMKRRLCRVASLG